MGTTDSNSLHASIKVTGFSAQAVGKAPQHLCKAGKRLKMQKMRKNMHFVRLKSFVPRKRVAARSGDDISPSVLDANCMKTFTFSRIACDSKRRKKFSENSPKILRFRCLGERSGLTAPLCAGSADALPSERALPMQNSASEESNLMNPLRGALPREVVEVPSESPCNFHH